MKKIITFLVLVFTAINGFTQQDNSEQIKNDFKDKSVIKDYERIMKKYGDGADTRHVFKNNLEKRYDHLKELADKGYAPAQFEYAESIMCLNIDNPNKLMQDGLTPEDRGKLLLDYYTKAGNQWYLKAIDWIIEHASRGNNGQCIYNKFTNEELVYWTDKKGTLKSIQIQKSAEAGNVDDMIALGRDYLEIHEEALASKWLLRPEVIENLEFFRNDNNSNNDDYRKLLAFVDAQKLKNNSNAANFTPKEAYDTALHFNNLYDYTNGLIWMQNSAKDGYTFAQTDLGNMYYQGQGTPVNYKLAFEYWTKASDKGEPNATNHLSYFCYFLGYGITANPQKAYDLITSIKNPETLPSYPAKLKEIKEGLNFINTEKKANLGDALAQEEIANYYLNGKGTTKSEAKALEYFTKSAAQGNSNAEIQMADLYLTGTTTPFNDTKAYALLQKNSNLMSNQRDYLMGFCFYHGYGTSKNLSKALEYFNKSNDNRKNLYYAYYYYFGYAGVAQSYENAKSSLEKINLDNEGQKFYDNVLGQLKYDKSLIMDTCPVCKGTGITYSTESFTYTTQEDAYKRETVLVYDPSSNFSKVENREKTRAVTNTGTKEVQHTCSRCNGTGKVHRY